MRLAAIVASLTLTGSALAGTGYVAPADRALLGRAPTAQEQLLGSISSRLAQRPVSVRCGNTHSKEALGSVVFLDGRPSDYAILSPYTCKGLAAFAASPQSFDPGPCSGSACAQQQAAAMVLEVVAHESYHLWGARDEAKAECYGLQSIFYVANRLGAPLDEAKALGHLYWTTVYRQHGTEWPSYYSPACRSGGSLDLRPGDPRWPE
jgi:hypothetical protein